MTDISQHHMDAVSREARIFTSAMSQKVCKSHAVRSVLEGIKPMK